MAAPSAARDAAAVIQVDPEQPDCLWVLGALDFYTVAALLEQGRQWIASAPSTTGLCIDLSQLGHVDSAGLALLLAWYRFARQSGKRLCFRGLSSQLLSMMEVSSIRTILPVLE